MIPWVQVYSNLLDHPKTYKLADELNITSAFVDPNAIAAAMLVGLWTWASQNAYKGDLSSCGARAIAGACRWKKKPEALLNALINCRWLDEDMRLHDWEEYASLYMGVEDAKKEKVRQRVQRYRDRKHNADVTPDATLCNAQESVTCNAGVTVTSALRNADVTPLPDQTITIPDPSNVTSSSTIAGKAEEDIKRARARGEVCRAYESRFGKSASSTILPEIDSFLDTMEPAVLIRAITIATDAGIYDWRYARGILEKYKLSGVRTLAAAESLDAKHRQGSGRDKRLYYADSATGNKATSESIDRLDGLLERQKNDETALAQLARLREKMSGEPS